MASSALMNILSVVVIFQLGVKAAPNGSNKQSSTNNGGLPYANSAATSSGTVPNGTINLGNVASAGYSSSNGFQAASNTQNLATGPNSSIQSTASANAVSGVFANQSWNVVANSNGISSGTAAAGQLQNQDRSNITATQNIFGQGQSQISGTGVQLNLQSTANAAAYAQQTNAQQAAVRGKSAFVSISVQSGTNHTAVSYQLKEHK